MKRVVIGILSTPRDAEDVLSRLQLVGIPSSEVSVLLPDREGSRDFAHEHSTKAPEGAIAGVATGGVIGGTLGLLAGIGAIAIPGVGPLIAAGPLMGALSGAAGGAAVGGVAGALIGFGIPEYEAKHYEGKIREGNVLVGVHVENAEARQRVLDVMNEAGARDISVTSESSVPESHGKTGT
ncbi:MAG TPA: DUF3341 domain-containing protein [Polyangiaceae bacterium]|nr:DUF3341 domain-containing protein [Polyangiaceae bacterium]